MRHFNKIGSEVLDCRNGSMIKLCVYYNQNVEYVMSTKNSEWIAMGTFQIKIHVLEVEEVLKVVEMVRPVTDVECQQLQHQII